MTANEALNFWLTALSEPIGLLLSTNDPHRAKTLLYRARANSGDERLADLQIRTSPFQGGELVICKGRVDSNAVSLFGARNE